MRESLEPLLALRDAGSWRAEGDDDIEVWICRVPIDSTAAAYGGLPLRLPLAVDEVVEVLNVQVSRYFDTISHGGYRPRFNVGGDVAMAPDDDPQACVDRALADAADSADVVFAVADAEHGPAQPGGFGNGGVACASAPPCSVAESRRVAYVGASDFHPVWGTRPPMDLIEHEIGHTLGWTHSGYVAGAVTPYQSGLDLMSNSAAPRDIDPARRDGPDTLGINRLLAGWLAEDDVWVAPTRGGAVTLAPSTSASGTRLAIVALPDGNYLTVELLHADGYNAHLPHAGIAVHRVVMVAGEVRSIDPLVGSEPYTALLQSGETFDSDGWRIELNGEEVSITPNR